MKSKFLTAFLLTLFLSAAQAQTISASYTPATGDIEMDNFLKDVNVQAKADPGKFKLDLNIKFNVPAPKVDELLVNMAPGDVYMSLQIGQTTHKPVEEVKTVYLKNKGKGWGVIAKELGIKPGSAEFHALKKSMKKPAKSEGVENEKEEKGNPGKGKGHGKGKK